MKNLTNSLLSSDYIPSLFDPAFNYFAIFFIVISLLLGATNLFYKHSSKATQSKFQQFMMVLGKKINAPLIFLLIFSLLHFAIALFFLSYPKSGIQQKVFIAVVFPYLIKFFFPIGLLWLIWKMLDGIQLFVSQHALIAKNSWLSAFFSLASNGVKAAIILLIANISIPWLGLTSSLQSILSKVSHLLFIFVLGWIFFQLVNEGAKTILAQYNIDRTSDFTLRKITTQVILLKRIILTIGAVIICAAILLSFDNVKRLGTGLLTTAGIISAIGAFASQQSLSRLAAGLHMAFTQPIRIGDTVIIDNQLGTVEEISLSYIVVKVWNLRRLIIPADYLTQKGFNNLSRTSTQLLDTIFLHVDFTLPVQPIREKFFEFLSQSKFWDGQVKGFHVTDVTTSSMELRGLISAQDVGKLFELQCEIREKLIEFIVKNYPDHLPRQRMIQNSFLSKEKQL